MDDPFGVLQGMEISPKLIEYKLTELSFSGHPKLLVQKLKKLDSLGISQERVEKNSGIAFFGILSRTGKKKTLKNCFLLKNTLQKWWEKIQ